MSARLRSPRVFALVPAIGACVFLACKAAPNVAPAGVSSSDPSVAVTSAASTPASAPTASTSALVAAASCPARRPFVFASAPANERVLVLPAPFGASDACAALSAIFPDYDRGTERSTKAGGVVRARSAGVFAHGGRDLLVLIDYRGTEADEEFAGGCDPLYAHVSLLARASDGQGLTVVARASEPIAHAGVGSAVTFATGGAGSLPLRENDPALVLRSEHSCGTSPGRTAAHVLVVEGNALRSVLSAFVGARGMQRDNEIHEVAAALAPKAGRPRADAKDGFADLTLTWTDALCPFDDKAGDFLCGRGKPLGTDEHRYDGRKYVRRGPATKVPFL